MGCYFLLQGIFPTQGSNLGLLHRRQPLYRLSHRGSPSHDQFFVTSWTVTCQASLSFTISQSLLKLMSIESVMPSTVCHPFSSCPPSFSESVFSNESALHIRWPKYWSFSFSISPSNEYSGLISVRIDLFDLLAVEGTRKSLL